MFLRRFYLCIIQMKFATGAEKVAYYREKKKNEVKASKLKYYNENADKINRKISRPLEPSVISNAAIRQQKLRKNKAVIQGLYFDMKKQLSTDVRRTYKLNKKTEGNCAFSSSGVFTGTLTKLRHFTHVRT